MSKVIYKYPLAISGRSQLSTKIGAKIIHAEVQRGTPCVWAEVDVDAEDTVFDIIMVGTGNKCPADKYTKHIGTFVLEQGHLVLHAYLRTI
jgi:hypothetical protein